MLHELRVGEVARLGLTPLARYYGTVDATPLFLCLLCDYVDWSGDVALFRELRADVEAMLGWIAGRATATATGCSTTSARRPRACGARAGRTRTRASSTSAARRWSRR